MMTDQSAVRQVGIGISYDTLERQVAVVLYEQNPSMELCFNPYVLETGIVAQRLAATALIRAVNVQSSDKELADRVEEVQAKLGTKMDVEERAIFNVLSITMDWRCSDSLPISILK